MAPSIAVLALVYAYFYWRMFARHDKFVDALKFPIRYFCDKTGIWRKPQ